VYLRALMLANNAVWLCDGCCPQSSPDEQSGIAAGRAHGLFALPLMAMALWDGKGEVIGRRIYVGVRSWVYEGLGGMGDGAGFTGMCVDFTGEFKERDIHSRLYIHRRGREFSRKQVSQSRQELHSCEIEILDFTPHTTPHHQ
jgi:hypothetical protein